MNLLLHPYNLISSSQEHFTTKTSDVIRSYGIGADGTILGEGVGAVVLKTLADAKRDGDNIWGIIKEQPCPMLAYAMVSPFRSRICRLWR